jgi:hypothetical protein
MAVNYTGMVGVARRSNTDPLATPTYLSVVCATSFGEIDYDPDSDGIKNVLSPQGHQVKDFLGDPANPQGGAGGLAWNHATIWPDYEDRAVCRVGYQDYGFLEVNADHDLRYENFEVGLGGVGVLNITGFGSTCNAAREVIELEYRTAIAAAAVSSPLSTSFNPGSVTHANIPQTGTSFRQLDLPCIVGGSPGSRGEVNVVAGGRFEIGGGLVLARDLGSSATLTVGGLGSVVLLVGTAALDVRAGASVLLAGGGTIRASSPLLLAGAIVSSANDYSQAGGRDSYQPNTVTARTVSVRASASVQVGEQSTLEIVATETSPGSAIAGTGFSGLPAHMLGIAGAVVVNGGTLTLASATTDYPPVVLRTVAASGVTPSTGSIVVRDGELRLPQGLLNYGVIRLSGRVVVHGKMTNKGVAATTDPVAVGSQGVIVIDGDDADVVFADEVVNDGRIVTAPGARVLYAGGLSGTNVNDVRIMTGCPRPISVSVKPTTAEVTALVGTEQLDEAVALG